MVKHYVQWLLLCRTKIRWAQSWINFLIPILQSESEMPAYRGLKDDILELFISLELENFLVSIDEIERKTGLDFYSALDDEIESELEKNVSGEECLKISVKSSENSTESVTSRRERSTCYQR